MTRRLGDHPRTRGDHWGVGLSGSSGSGSPPHARGPRYPVRAVRGLRGITPARAGTTRRPTRRRSANRDHPRTRGDHRWRVSGRTPGRGSPPHARGPPVSGLAKAMWTGITPARAGTTRPRSRPSRTRWDHPRTRGDHSSLFCAGTAGRGSPPHARGPRVDLVQAAVADGITPARAGTTSPYSPWQRGARDHPRTRGDHGFISLCWLIHQGSPPHARGPPPYDALEARPALDHPRTRGTTVADLWRYRHRSLFLLTFSDLGIADIPPSAHPDP